MTVTPEAAPPVQPTEEITSTQHSAFIAPPFLAIATPLLAEEESVPEFAQDTLSGDWGGARGAAAKNGLLFEGGIKVDALCNRGALKDGSKTVSHIDLKLEIDLEKAAGWQGGSALINIVSDSGWEPDTRLVGARRGVTNIEAGAPTTTRRFQAWLQQSFLDERLAVLAGLYPIDSGFFAMDAAGVFLGPQYDTLAELALTDTPSVFNNSAFGIRAVGHCTIALRNGRCSGRRPQRSGAPETNEDWLRRR